MALGAGEIQSRTRRVAVCDLVGDVAPLESLVRHDDPHGIVDAFQYGISLNKVAYQIDQGGNLYVMPSGTEPVVDEGIMRHDRWRRLSGGFREVGALLLLVARADAPGLETLVAKTDGLIVAGRETTVPPSLPVLATARTPRASSRRRGARRRSSSGRVPLQHLPLSRDSSGFPRAAVGVAALVVLVAGGFYAARRIRSGNAAEGAERATATADSVADTMPAGEAGGPLPFGDDPADSALASPYALELVKLNTQSGAILKLLAEGSRLPAVTYSPALLGPEAAPWYVIVAGAHRERREADSLLDAIRRDGVVERDVGGVIRAPYALLLESQVTRESAPAVVRAYLAREVPAYALIGGDGIARIYAGAFERVEQASVLAPVLETAGIRPVVVYRIGRPF